MPPPLSWADLAGARVALWGLGVEGRANLRKAAALGLSPLVVDDRPPPDVEVVPASELARCDVVIKSPGISRYGPAVRELEARGVAVVGGLGLWLADPATDPSRVVVITGTKGKSTTTALLGHLLNRLGRPTLVAGNIGQPPYDPAVAGNDELVVVEVSSFQATDLATSPPLVAVTSLHPDHLDWHDGSAETYYRDKLSAASRLGARLTVANGDSPLLRERAHLLGPEVRWVSLDSDPAPWADGAGLLGGHNRRNAAIARACLEALGVAEAADPDRLAAAVADYEGLPSRLRRIATVAGVDFVDDSLSTNVLPTVAALEAFPDERLALIVGGFDRGIDYGQLGEALALRRAPTLVLAVPASGPRIRAEVEAVGLPAHVSVIDQPSLEAATVTGWVWARPAGVVLLSPAAPSFGAFRDYKDRAAAFATVAAALAETPPPPA